MGHAQKTGSGAPDGVARATTFWRLWCARRCKETRNGTSTCCSAIFLDKREMQFQACQSKQLWFLNELEVFNKLRTSSSLSSMLGRHGLNGIQKPLLTAAATSTPMQQL